MPAKTNSVLTTALTVLATVAALLGGLMIRPVVPVDPNKPVVVVPVTPVAPVAPVTPVTPVVPVTPDTPVTPTLKTGDIDGPVGDVKFGARLTYHVPSDIEQPQWLVVPPRLDTSKADADHTLQLSSDVPGGYTIVVAGWRGGKTIQWFATITIGPYAPPEPIKPIPTPNPGPNPGPTPTPAPWPTPVIPLPSAELQQALSPVKSVLDRADPAKALAYAEIWMGLGNVMKTKPVPATISELKSMITTYANAAALHANLGGAFPGFSAALETAFTAHFGSEDGSVNASRATDFVTALAWACSQK